jgi:cellulose synthase/poly-beta-1,6-N-acetylglucosamine synthase-like glycosyltransferase
VTETLAAWASALVVAGEQGILAFFLLLNSGYAILLLLAIPEIWRHWHISEDQQVGRTLAGSALPPLSILVPAHNEEVTIAASVLSFLTLEYPRHEVVVVNDGSKDGTMDALIAAYDLYEVPPAFPVTIRTQRVRAYYRSRTHSKLLVLDKENGGKADALNAAINAARFPYVIAVDADTLVESDALQRLARPFLLGESVAAVGGTIRVVNGCTVESGRILEARVDRRWLPGIQVVEYLRAFLFGRLGWNPLGGSLVISGAFGLFRRQYLLAIGGYQTGNVTEDMDLVVRLRRYLYEQRIEATVPFVPDPVAWTEVPSSIRVLGRQRERWHRGLIATLVAHRGLFFNPRYGRLGLLAFPFFVLEAVSPLVELAGYLLTIAGLLLGKLNVPFAVTFLGVAVAFGLLLSAWAVVLEDFTFRRYPRRADFLRLVFFAVVENVGYRQLTLWFRLQAFWKWTRGTTTWGEMRREGYGAGTGARRAVPQ